MCDICAAIRKYSRDEDDNVVPIRERLTSPPRELRRGERWDGTDVLYSAGWLNYMGDIIPFEGERA